MSQHPVDLLIQAMIASPSEAMLREADVRAIVTRMSSAPFSQERVRVPIRHRGLRYHGHVIERETESLTFHLVKRVVIDEQWADGTTVSQYLDDIRRAVLSPTARIVVYRRWGMHFAVTLTSTSEIIATDRLGSRWLPSLLVVYSADTATIMTAYMYSSMAELNLPGDTRWLK